ncbi:MAG: M15 family metallopeptidase [Candidatus Paceibacterota bacterium]
MRKDFLKFTTKKHIIIFSVFVLCFLVGYGYFHVYSNLKITKSELDSVKKDFQIKKIEWEGLLSQVTVEKQNLETALEEEQKKSGTFQSKIEDITNTVEKLEKLRDTDPELLQKYSKVFFLNEHYEPEEVVDIDEKFLEDKNKPQQIHAGVWPHLRDMLEDALDDDVVLTVVSGYRSFSEQTDLKTGYKFIYGAGTANQFSADQGYSEHQLGTAVDFSTPDENAVFTSFESTKAYKWLSDNAYRYGFILSYPKGNIYYQFEPWHWRFVGESLARSLHRKNINFYDMDQRDINKYLVKIFD